MIDNEQLVVITNVELQGEDGGTVGWIVPDGTSPDTALELEAVDHITIPSTEHEDEWYQGFRSALSDAGYALVGRLGQDGPVVTAAVAVKGPGAP